MARPKVGAQQFWEHVGEDLAALEKCWGVLRKDVRLIKRALGEAKPDAKITVTSDLLDAVAELSTTVANCPSISPGGSSALCGIHLGKARERATRPRRKSA